MRVISKSRLKEFWENPNCEGSEGPMRSWYTHVSSKGVAWHNWGDVRSSLKNADLVGNCVVFNIGGNKYRLITRVLYRSQKVFILKVMTHKEYDKGKWKEDCGCFSVPPKNATKKLATKKNAKKQREK